MVFFLFSLLRGKKETSWCRSTRFSRSFCSKYLVVEVSVLLIPQWNIGRDLKRLEFLLEEKIFLCSAFADPSLSLENIIGDGFQMWSSLKSFFSGILIVVVVGALHHEFRDERCRGSSAAIEAWLCGATRLQFEARRKRDDCGALW